MTAAREPTDGATTGEAGDVHGFVGAGLQLLDLEASEAEIAVIEAAYGLYSPEIDRLLDAELDGVDPEPGVDLSQPPA
jgi:hypothetical protein